MSKVALHGNLKDFGIADVFQLIGQQRKTGLLEIEGDPDSVVLAFDGGSVVWASPASDWPLLPLAEALVRCGWLPQTRLEAVLVDSRRSARSLSTLLVEHGDVSVSQVEEVADLLTRETIFNVMRWNCGVFHFTAQPVDHQKSSEKLLSAEQILMEGLRWVDEWPTFCESVPREEIVFRRVLTAEMPDSSPASEDRSQPASWLRILAHVNGRSSARRIIDLSRLGTFEGTRILAELRSAAVIEPVSGLPGSVSRERLRAVAAPFAEAARYTMLSVLALALLAGVAGVALQKTALWAPPRQGYIRPAPLEVVAARFRSRRLHNAIEASHYVTGQFPGDLADPTAWKAVRRLALTPQDAGDYYYHRKNDGVILLAPER
ncbi:MAG: DUF4388 domain-containing protein [Myxococcota bacterium]|nr:DUF4388 domain-containing protein [Myxococcota bacterium]